MRRVVISDSSMFAPGIPSLLSSLRGLAYFQIDVRGPAQDLHSGIYGGAVMNPAMALARILATMHDADGRVAIPGFYDDVRDWPASVREGFAKLPFDEEDIAETSARPSSAARRAIRSRAQLDSANVRSERPAVGLHRRGREDRAAGDGDGEGELPPGSGPDARARSSAHEGARRSVCAERCDGDGARRSHGGRHGARRSSGPFFDAARRALRAAFGREPVITGEGGSIPVVGDFQRILGAPVLLIGFGLPGENAHAPGRVDVRGELLQGHGGHGDPVGRARARLIPRRCAPVPIAAPRGQGLFVGIGS